MIWWQWWQTALTSHFTMTEFKAEYIQIQGGKAVDKGSWIKTSCDSYPLLLKLQYCSFTPSSPWHWIPTQIITNNNALGIHSWGPQQCMHIKNTYTSSYVLFVHMCICARAVEAIRTYTESREWQQVCVMWSVVFVSVSVYVQCDVCDVMWCVCVHV